MSRPCLPRRLTPAELPEGAGAPIPLSALADAVPDGRLVGDAVVRGISDDSRTVRRGSLFFAMRGAHSDGHRYVGAAVAAGAVAVVVERELDLDLAGAAQLVVPSVRASIGPMSARFHGDPADHLAVIGVTGTNGKTTTSSLLRSCLSTSGLPTGQIGTVGCHFEEWAVPGTLTTPGAPFLQATLADMARRGAVAVAMEVSSHALDQHRVDGTRFRLGIFTNLSGEHLDYHGTMEHYWASKAELFDPRRCDRAVICVDDDWGRRLAHQARIPVVTFGHHADADVRVSSLELGLEGLSVTLRGVDGDVVLSSRLVGHLNASNVAAAYLGARSLGVAAGAAVAGIAGSGAPPGRFEVVDEGQPFLVVVDYAHTPDALAGLIRTARGLTGLGGRISVVVGARGGRDRFKRPYTGRAAATADRVVLTTDSPGDEPVGPIMDQLRLGTVEAPGRAEVLVEPDRKVAIALAVERAGPGDVVLVVGRGHEVLQHVGGKAVLLDDRMVAREALAGWLERRWPVPSDSAATA